MRHLNQGRKLNRTSAHRKALFRNLVLSLVRYERIKTTDAKAKELRRYADRMVTLGKRGDLAARRLAYNFMQSRDAVKKLFDEIAPRFKDRAGGYTRVVKFGMRRGAVNAAPPPPRNALSQFAGFRGYREYTLAREFPSAGPSPARHGGCKKTKDSNRRAACPLPQLSGRGIFRKLSTAYTHDAASVTSGKIPRSLLR